MFEYKAIVKKVYDGDTITVDIDLGFNIWQKNQKIRLADINAPEIRGEEREQGLISRDKLREWLPLGKIIRLVTLKDRKGKYGRYIGYVFPYGDDENFRHIKEIVRNNTEMLSYNQRMIQEGFAKPY